MSSCGQCPLYPHVWTLSTTISVMPADDHTTAAQTHANGLSRPRRLRPPGGVRTALVEAGLDLARTGGPDAVVLREVTRQVGVVPNAAYRHFADRDALLAAVRDE